MVLTSILEGLTCQTITSPFWNLAEFLALAGGNEFQSLITWWVEKNSHSLQFCIYHRSVSLNGSLDDYLFCSFPLNMTILKFSCPLIFVMLVGDSGVGKTCLLVRFKDGAFLAGSFISTVGIDFRNKVLNVDAVKVKLQIWDTAGQERFRSVTHAYYRDAHALLLLYDVTNRASFDNIQAWLTEIHEYAQQDVVLMLLGNKVSWAWPQNGSRLVLQEYGVPFMETSAKSGLNVDLAFTAIAKELKHRSMKLPNEPKFKLHDYVKKEVRGSGCCRS
uniref:small monomeric GTPase n=1 Tax=Chelydra serpentina TaxID=8475 RepID=A0A8C3STG7_CHESE